MKATRAQRTFDFIKGDPLEDMGSMISHMKGNLKDVAKRIEDQEAALKEMLPLLKEIQAALFDIQQGEIFTDEGTETFERLRRATNKF
jgi:hypothetical protein